MIVQISDIFVVVTAAAIFFIRFFFHPPFNIRIFLSAFYYPHFFIRIRHPQVSGPRFTDTHCRRGFLQDLLQSISFTLTY